MKIVVLLRHAEVRAWTFSPENRQRFLAAYPDADIVICRDELELERALGDAEIAIVWRFNQDWFCRAPKLKWLATPAAGKEYLNVSPPVGVKMVFGSFHGELMGETVLALMLGHCRGLFAAAILLSRRAHASASSSIALPRPTLYMADRGGSKASRRASIIWSVSEPPGRDKTRWSVSGRTESSAASGKMESFPGK
jgi:hypothetical protein